MSSGILLPSIVLTSAIQYAPSTLATYNLDSSTIVAVDPSNITISRVVPASGSVLVGAEITIRSTVTANFPQLDMGLVTHSTSVQVGYKMTGLANSNFNQSTNTTLQLRWHGSWVLTGLVPGDTLSLDLAYTANTTGVFNAYADQSVSPAIMTITDL